MRIVLIDDHDVVRTGLRSILEQHQAMEVVGEASDGRTGLEVVARLKPDVVLMDISMPALNGIDATRQIRASCADARIIVLSMHSDRQLVIEMLKAGAAGYLTKDSAAQHLLTAVRAVRNGKAYLAPEIAGVVVDSYLHNIPAGGGQIATLSGREREVLQLLAEGKTSKEIAAVLHVSPKTVESHRAQIMDKLNIHSVAELTKFAVRAGLTALDQ